MKIKSLVAAKCTFIKLSVVPLDSSMMQNVDWCPRQEPLLLSFVNTEKDEGYFPTCEFSENQFYGG